MTDGTMLCSFWRWGVYWHVIMSRCDSSPMMIPSYLEGLEERSRWRLTMMEKVSHVKKILCMMTWRLWQCHKPMHIDPVESCHGGCLPSEEVPWTLGWKSRMCNASSKHLGLVIAKWCRKGLLLTSTDNDRWPNKEEIHKLMQGWFEGDTLEVSKMHQNYYGSFLSQRQDVGSSLQAWNAGSKCCSLSSLLWWYISVFHLKKMITTELPDVCEQMDMCVLIIVFLGSRIYNEI